LELTDLTKQFACLFHLCVGAGPTDLNDSPMLIGPPHRLLDAVDWSGLEFQDAVEGGVTTVVTGPRGNASGMAVVIGIQ